MSVSDLLNIGLWRRFPLVLQTEASECGLASLAMIASYHGQATELGELRRRFGSTPKGATLRDVMKVGHAMGFVTRALRLELSELGQLKLPCILHWDLNHFVVLERVGADSVRVHDPAVGSRQLKLDEASRHFTGIALEILPSRDFGSTAATPRVSLKSLIGHVRGWRGAIGNLAALSLAIELFAVVAPLFLSWVVDNVLVSGDRDLLVTLTAGYLLLIILRTAIEFFRGWVLMGVTASLKVQSRANLFRHLQSLPTSFFENRHVADIMSRFSSQDTILQTISTDALEALFDGLLALLTLVLMFAFSPTLTVIVLIGAVLYAVLRRATYTPLRHASNEAIVWAARRDSHFLETLRGARTIKLFSGEDERRARWLNLLIHTLNRQLSAEKMRLVFRASNSLLMGVVTVLVVWFGALGVLGGSFSVGMLIAFIAYKDQFLSRIIGLINKLTDLTMLRLHAERLADIALTAPEPTGDTMAVRAQPETVHLEVRNLAFKYGEREPLVLSDVSFTARPGESIAIVGPSGGGKTTLLKLLCGLMEPTSGKVLINGEPLYRIGAQHYRSMIGVVMQDDQLFAGSIADNISFFAERPDMALVEHCAKLASVHDDVAAMPMNYSTLIGDMGTMLSGGQKQRILIARALYRKPRIMFLDEATSHLDIDRESAVNSSLRTTGVTRVVIAHRPETIAASDRIISIVNGVAFEQSPPRHVRVS